MTMVPERGFSLNEFEYRMERVQEQMHHEGMDAILLTTEADVRYFTGFFTQFWQSPTRPWFVILPLNSKPIAIIPEIGASGMRDTWVDDIYTWPAPRPDDDGINLLASVINNLPVRYGSLGFPLGPETMIRMPGKDFEILKDKVRQFSIKDAGQLLLQLRFIKSAEEIAKLEHICGIASDAFEALPAYAAIGQSERQICKQFRIDLLQRGADTTPYIISGSGPGGYDSIIMGPSDRKLGNGDILIIDTGATFDGYFCDFDRNFAFGSASDEARAAYEIVYQATDAGLAAAKPGVTTGELWQAMWQVLEQGGATDSSVGRLGHGLGSVLTEWPSITPDNSVVLKPGAVVTLEPGMEFAPGKQMVHEENIVITEDGARMISRRAARELPVVG